MRSLLCATLLLLVSNSASAHGGLPIAQQIIVEGETLIVPTKYWGVFLGPSVEAGGGGWRWICEEAINQQQARKWAYAKSGAFHVTDFVGITSSRDGGCTWVQSTGEIQLRSTSGVVAHPVEASRAWATTDQGGTVPWNALFRSDDDGLTWSVPSEDIKADEYLRGVVVSPDGKRLYVTGFPRGGNPGDTTVLHTSSDGGATWKAVPVPWQQCDGATPPKCFIPDRLVPIAVDPSDSDTVYLRVESPTLMVLLAAHPDGSARELLRVPSEDKKPGIGGMAFVPEQRAVLVSTGQGPYRSIGGGPMERFGNLSRGECLSMHGASLYACGWNYMPDFMAIARAPLGEAAGAPTFTKVFNYDETCGPVTTCAPTTPVGMICPDIWTNYGAQLGATGESCGDRDGGSDGGVTMTGGGCSCDLLPERGPMAGSARTAGLIVGGVLVGWWTVRRRRRAAGRAGKPDRAA